MRREILGLIVMTFVASCSSSPSSSSTTQSSDGGSKSADAYPVRWSNTLEEYGLHDLADLNGVTKNPVPLEFDDHAPVFVKVEFDEVPTKKFNFDENDERVTIVTCDDYISLIENVEKAGMPESRADLVRMFPFVQICDTLRYLEYAKPAKRSYVESLTFDVDTTKQLLPHITLNQSTATTQPSDTGAIATIPDSMIHLQPDGTVKVGQYGSYTTLEPVVWADFNDDGVEDVLLFVVIIHPNMQWCLHRIVTKIEADGPFAAVELDINEEIREKILSKTSG